MVVSLYSLSLSLSLSLSHTHTHTHTHTPPGTPATLFYQSPTLTTTIPTAHFHPLTSNHMQTNPVPPPTLLTPPTIPLSLLYSATADNSTTLTSYITHDAPSRTITTVTPNNVYTHKFADANTVLHTIAPINADTYAIAAITPGPPTGTSSVLTVTLLTSSCTVLSTKTLPLPLLSPILHIHAHPTTQHVHIILGTTRHITEYTMSITGPDEKNDAGPDQNEGSKGAAPLFYTTNSREGGGVMTVLMPSYGDGTLSAPSRVVSEPVREPVRDAMMVFDLKDDAPSSSSVQDGEKSPGDGEVGPEGTEGHEKGERRKKLPCPRLCGAVWNWGSGKIAVCSNVGVLGVWKWAREEEGGGYPRSYGDLYGAMKRSREERYQSLKSVARSGSAIGLASGGENNEDPEGDTVTTGTGEAGEASIYEQYFDGTDSKRGAGGSDSESTGSEEEVSRRYSEPQPPRAECGSLASAKHACSGLDLLVQYCTRRNHA